MAWDIQTILKHERGNLCFYRGLLRRAITSLRNNEQYASLAGVQNSIRQYCEQKMRVMQIAALEGEQQAAFVSATNTALNDFYEACDGKYD